MGNKRYLNILLDMRPRDGEMHTRELTFVLDPPYYLPKRQFAYLIKEMITNVKCSCFFVFVRFAIFCYSDHYFARRKHITETVSIAIKALRPRRPEIVASSTCGKTCDFSSGIFLLLINYGVINNMILGG